MCSNCGWDNEPDEPDFDAALEEEKLNGRTPGYIARHDPDRMERLIARDTQRAAGTAQYANWEYEVSNGVTKLSFKEWLEQKRAAEGAAPVKIEQRKRKEEDVA
jgi:hypothetical protein